jgi:acyl transferase domain-containing protein
MRCIYLASKYRFYIICFPQITNLKYRFTEIGEYFMEEQEFDNPIEEIAVIGMAGRFPQASNIFEYWNNLVAGKESVTFFKDEELSENISPDVINHPDYVKANAVLDKAEYFDASFFDISHREAEIMDPQHRIFLECAWESLESSGYNPSNCPGVVSIYAGVDLSSYLMNVFSNREVIGSMGALQAIMNNDKDHLCTRVSHKLNLHGASVVVQSACSTSLTSVHLACRGLLTYECDMALAGGSSVKFPQESGHFFQEGGINSPDGHCRAFDHRAKGTVGGNGVGLVVLKRLSDALKDGDFIHAIIKGSAVNNDGSNKMSYAAPSVEGQAEVISMAHQMAGVNPETITYVETHGTATELGDTIEIEALTQAFRRQTDKKGFCGVGSVKTNIGHLDAAAGIAGLIKTILSLKQKKLPPSLHFEKPNPNIDFGNSPFYVNAALKEWETDGFPRRAGVSSYGMGGTNVHVVLEEYKMPVHPKPKEKPSILLFSAQNKNSLERMTGEFKDFLKNQQVRLIDAAYTLSTGRKLLNFRRFIIGNNQEEIIGFIENSDKKPIQTQIARSANPKQVWLFPGQGTQVVNMGKNLYQTDDFFKEQIDNCVEILKKHLGFDLREILFTEKDNQNELNEKLKQTAFTQPALFTVEYSLAKWLGQFGLTPFAMIGHSIGEYVAACLAGVFTLEEALGLVAKRGQLMQKPDPGEMVAVNLSEAEIQPFLNEQISLATVNSPNLCVLSGETEFIEKLEKQLSEKDVVCHKLHTSHAFHSSMMEPVLAEFLDEIRKIKLKKPEMPFLSNLTGKWITDEEAVNPQYWVDHLRNTVRFSDNVKQLLSEQELCWVEIGPGQTLTNLTRQHLNGKQTDNLIQMTGRHQNQAQDYQFALQTLGKLWQFGFEINWQPLFKDQNPQRVMLPTYSFERQKYWIKFNTGTSVQTRNNGVMPFEEWFHVPVWKQIPPFSSENNKVPKTEKTAIFYHQSSVQNKEILSLINNEKIVSASDSDAFAVTGKNKFGLNFNEKTDFFEMFQTLQNLNEMPDLIVFALPVTKYFETKNTREEFNDLQELFFYPLLNLLQAIEKANITKPIKLALLVNYLFTVAGDEQIIPEKATLSGLSKVISQEYPNIVCKIIDLDETGLTERTEDAFENYLLNVFENLTGKQTIALRKGKQWLLDYQPVKMPQINSQPSVLRENGSYLITGGLGGVGMILAEYLAQTLKASLILMGRSDFPEKADWENHLNNHPEDDISLKIKKIQNLEKLGSKVHVICCDVSDKASLSSAIASIQEKIGKINGVIHGAGISGERSIRTIGETRKTECEWHFAPKVYGLQNLFELIKDLDLDFCLLLSSLSAVLGGLGFGAYAAANSFMDSYVEKHENSSKFPIFTVDWDGWLIGKDLPESPLEIFSMTPSEGFEAFGRILERKNLCRVVVSKGNLEERMKLWLNLERNTEQNETNETKESNTYPRPDISEPYAEPQNETEMKVEKVWSELLGIENIGINDNFFELGGHSLLATRLVSRIRRIFDIELPLRTFFETPTISELAELIQTHQSEQFTDDQIVQMAEEIKSFTEDELLELLKTEKENENKK